MSAKAEAEGGGGRGEGGATLETEWGNLLIVECAGCQFGEFGAQMFADCKGYVATTLATISHTHTHTLTQMTMAAVCGTKSMQG